MGNRTIRKLILVAAMAVSLIPNALAQNRPVPDAQLIARRNAIEAELQSIAVVERKVMVPMRDGVRMAADVYRPKGLLEEIPDHLLSNAVQL
jgi:predicted acyl esterase